MKPTLLKFICLAALFLGGQIATVAADGGHATVRALLVLASNQHGASDARLSAYEPNLRRILRFESYKLVGEGSVALSAGKAEVSLGRGHVLELEPEKGEGKAVRVRINWRDGSRSLMNTGLILRPGVPAVLGGPANGKDEVWAVILVAG